MRASQRLSAELRLVLHDPDRRLASYATDAMQATDRMAPFNTASKNTSGLDSDARYAAICAA